MGKGWPWRKPKHDPEAESLAAKKKKKPRIHMFVIVDVAHALYRERTPCAPVWTDFHLPGDWRLSHRRVSMLSVQQHERERRHEITRRRTLLTPDLLADPTYGFDSPMWDSFSHLEWDPRRRVGFLSDDDYKYAAPLAPMKEEKEEEEEEREDNDDLHAYFTEKAKEEGKVDELPLMPEGVDETSL